MPRDITVKFSDGSTHMYRGAPDDITPEAVTARAQSEFPDLQVTALDGGRGKAPKATTAARAPKSPRTPSALRPGDAKSAIDRGSAELEAKIAKLPPKYQQMARDKYFSDPRVAGLRVASARPAARPSVPKPVESKSLLRQLPGGNFLGDLTESVSAATGRSLFGVPEMAAAALIAPFSDRDYGEVLDDIRQDTDRQRAKSVTGNVLGTVYGAVAGGNAAGAAVRGIGGKVAGSSAPAAVRAAGRALQGSATVRRGQNVRNVAKLALGGAAGGAAQAAGEGSDVSTAATVGAVAPVALKGLGKVAGFALRPVADLVKTPSAGRILRRFTDTSLEEMEQAAVRFRQETGADPTLYEILPLKDRNRLAKQILKRAPDTSEQVSAAVRQRVANIGPEMSATTRIATGGPRARALQRMQADLATARGGTNLPEDVLIARAATRSPLDLENLRRTEASATMQPVDDMPVADDLDALFPTAPRMNPDGSVEEVYSDPELNALIRNAAGAMRLRPTSGEPTADVSGLTVNDITRLIDKLGDTSPASTNFLASQRAVNHLLDSLPTEARELADQMRAAYAARSRQMEGMAEGVRTRTRAAVPVNSRAAGQEAGNAYDTPEGATGRLLGQSNVLQRDFAGGGDEVLRRTLNIAESGQTQEALTGNLGGQAADTITRAARAQTESARRLAAVGNETSREADTAGPEDIARMLVALSPGTFATTKMGAIAQMVRLTRLPTARARQIVDMLFSQDADVTNAAISLLRRAGPQGRSALDAIGKSVRETFGSATGNIVGQAGNSDIDTGAMLPSAEAAESDTPFQDADGDGTDDAEGIEGTVTDTGEYEEIEPGDYTAQLEQTYAEEDPEFLDLWQRQTGQESNRQQFDGSGDPLESSAGAIGIAQVMPGTAPEAARLAGLPWDEDAYYSDPAYNELIGMAYMREMLRKFGGDVELALAAYNAGPGAVQKAGGVPRIAETQDYVDRIMRGG